MRARIPNKSYLAIGFGENMRGTDMIVWRWKDDTTLIDNLWSDGYSEPPTDNTDFLKNEIEMSADGRFKMITTRRAFDTGNNKDFVIQPDMPFVWCYAYRTGNGDFLIHKEREIFSVEFSSSGVAVERIVDLTEFKRNDFYEAHGWWMWTAWMPIGLLLLITKRYAKKHWNCMHMIHSLLGLFVVMTTLVWTFKIIDYFDWEFNTDLHSIAGFISCTLSVVVGASGSFTAALAQFYNGEKAWTPKEKVTKAGKFHKQAGYFMLFIGNATAMTGIGHYYADIVEDQQMASAGMISLGAFCLLVMIFECFYRRTNRKTDMTVKTPESDHNKKGSNCMVYTSDQIDRGVAAGIPLLIFDNLVLNLNGYERLHPGGKFVLKQNFGRDISKFFNGGYSLI